MNPFLLTLDSIGALLLCVLSLVIISYLSTIRDKDAATWWLLATMGSFCSLFCLRFFLDSLNPAVFDSRGWTEVVSGLSLVDLSWFFFLLLLLLFSLSFLQFVYVFLHDPFRRERRLVLLLGSVASLTLICWIAWLRHLFRITDGIEGTLLIPYVVQLCILFFGWAVVVLVRKERHAGTSVPRSGVLAFRAYVVLALIPLIYFAGLMLQSTTIGQTQWSWGPGVLGIVGFCCGLVVVYLNHAPQPTSLQVKLIGLTLTTLIGLLAVIGLALFNAPVVSLPERQTVQFEPDTLMEGGYHVEHLPYRFDERPGEVISLTDDGVRGVALPWPFPFGEHAWDSLYVYSNGFVSFGSPFPNAFAQWSHIFDVRPKIVPLFIDLNPAGGGQVDVGYHEDSITITWRNVPFYAATDVRYNFQLDLSRDGGVIFSYSDNSPYPGSIATSEHLMRGLFPGGGAAESTAHWSARLPLSLAPGEALSENIKLRVRLDLHKRLVRFFWIIVGGTLFVLIIFPSFFRSSLVRPLRRLQEGVHRVEKGQLDTHVQVHVHDEVGYLTHQFNRMTESLRTYAEQMDDLVAQRTAELEQSLEELHTTQAQLIQQEKMASLGQLTAGIAHEIKNPLNFVNNFAEINEELADELEDALDADEDKAALKEIIADLRKNAQVIKQHGKRADGIVHAMMQHASGGSGQRVATDLNHLISEHIDLAYHGKRAQMPEMQVEINRNLNAQARAVEIVPQEIGRVLLNLLGNAFDAVQEHAANVNGQYEPTVTVSTQRKGDAVEIRVADNGPGIPAEIKDKIFEPFFTTKPTGSGTGLGLSLSYDIITQGHAGTMTVESEEGQGATFIIMLPVNHRAPESSA